MPLVTRSGNQGIIFKQDADPASEAVAGDLWSETDTNTLSRRNDADDGWLEVIPSPVVTALQLNDTSADHQYIFTVNELSADRNVNMPLLTGNDVFVFAAFAAVFTNKTFDANATGNSLSNVDVADLANGVDGELITWDANGAPATVGVGTALQVLTSKGVGIPPTFEDGGGQWELLDDHNASGTESSYTFTPSVALTSANYSAIIIYYQTEPTAGFELRLELNAVAGDAYRSRGWSSDGVTLVNIGTGTDSSFVLASSTVMRANESQQGWVMLQLLDTRDRLSGMSEFNSTENILAEYMHHSNGATWTSLTAIKSQTSTSTWKAGTRITTYGVKRT